MPLRATSQESSCNRSAISSRSSPVIWPYFSICRLRAFLRVHGRNVRNYFAGFQLPIQSRAEQERASRRVPPLLLPLKEQVPVPDASRIADECSHRQFLRRSRHVQQFQTSLVRETIAFLRVHGFIGPDEIFPCVLAAA